MVYIANELTPDSPKDVKIYSNCEHVQISIDGGALQALKADQDRYSDNLQFPSYTLHLKQPAQKIEVVGLIANTKTASHTRTAPVAAKALQLSADLEKIPVAVGEKDVFIVHTAIVDGNETVLMSEFPEVTFSIEGPARLIGENPIKAEAGIASIVVESSGEKGSIVIKAESQIGVSELDVVVK